MLKMDMDELLSESDLISLHCPLTDGVYRKRSGVNVLVITPRIRAYDKLGHALRSC